MTDQDLYKDALIGIWRKLGKICPNDLNRLEKCKAKEIERAYYLAENALYQTRVLNAKDGALQLTSDKAHE